MSSILPPYPGILPYWLILISGFSLLNTVGCYLTKAHALRTYEGPTSSSEVTAFGSRMFGTWTSLSCLIRIYCAYNIESKDAYSFALITYIIALAHFGSEWLVYGTMKMGKGLVPVLGVAASSIVWMIMQWDFYVVA